MLMLPKTCPVCLQDSLAAESGYINCTNCATYRIKARFWQGIYAWTLGKYWWLRLPAFLWFWYTSSKYLHDGNFAMHRVSNFISAIDFGMHELGHFLFIPFGTFMTILGGSLTQVLFPLIWVGIAIHRRWYFAAGLCLAWVGLSLIDVSVYAGDAQMRILPLVSLGSDYDAAHDWYQMLSRLDMLEQTDQIATAIRTSGIVCIVVGMGWSALLMISMFADSVQRLAEGTPKTNK